MTSFDEVPLKRDQLIALMVAEKDAELAGRGTVRVVQWADEVERRTEAVELIAADDVGTIVVEHTRIESYPDQVDDRMAASKIFPLHGVELPERPNAGRYTLTVRPAVLATVPYKERARVAQILTDWVRENVDRVPWPHVPGEPIYITGSHPQLTFQWALWQAVPNTIGLVGPYERVIQISYSRPENLEEMRRDRLTATISKKVPKLLKAAGEDGRSILVLEERDTTLSSPLDVSLAMQAAAEDAPMPDVIYMLNTRMGNPLLCTIREHGLWAHETNDPFWWKTFSDARSSELNYMPTNWA